MALRNKRPVRFGAPPALPAPLLIHAGRRPVCKPTLYGGGRGAVLNSTTPARDLGAPRADLGAVGEDLGAPGVDLNALTWSKDVFSFSHRFLRVFLKKPKNTMGFFGFF